MSLLRPLPLGEFEVKQGFDMDLTAALSGKVLPPHSASDQDITMMCMASYFASDYRCLKLPWGLDLKNHEADV